MKVVVTLFFFLRPLHLLVIQVTELLVMALDFFFMFLEIKPLSTVHHPFLAHRSVSSQPLTTLVYYSYKHPFSSSTRLIFVPLPNHTFNRT